MDIGNKITELRKQKKWSQADLSSKVGVTREIIGRYERNEVLPSIEVAKNIAEALDVSLDYLIDGKYAEFDKDTIKLIKEIQELEPNIKEKLLYLANAVIRDFKTQKAYSL